MRTFKNIALFAVIGLAVTLLFNVAILHGVRNGWIVPRGSAEYFQWDRWNATVSSSRWHTEYQLIRGPYENDSHEERVRWHVGIAASAMAGAAAQSDVTIGVYGTPLLNGYWWTLRAPVAFSFAEKHGVEVVPLMLGTKLAVPTRFLALETAGNTAFWGGAVWIAWAWLGRWRRLSRQRAGRCAGCGYDMKGLALGAVCPECGAMRAVDGADGLDGEGGAR